MTSQRQLRGLHPFDQVDFAQAPCPAVLLAISGAPPDDILPAAQDAIQKVRGLDTATDDIRSLTILEMDYAFTNLGFFMSCVGDYRANPSPWKTGLNARAVPAFFTPSKHAHPTTPARRMDTSSRFSALKRSAARTGISPNWRQQTSPATLSAKCLQSLRWPMPAGQLEGGSHSSFSPTIISRLPACPFRLRT